MQLFHIAVESDWRAALAAGTYDRSTRGASLAEVGFIHCSLREQVARVGEFIYGDGTAGDLLVLELDGDLALAAGAEVRFEDGGSGELFPHLYGAIDPAWVVAAHAATAGGGAFTWGVTER